MNFLPSEEAFIHTCENTTDQLKPDRWSVTLMDEKPTILGPKMLASLSLQRAGDSPQPTGCCCPSCPASLAELISAGKGLRAALVALSGATGQ